MASYQHPYSPSSGSELSTPRSSSPASTSSRSSTTTVSKRMSISSARRVSGLNPMASVDIAAIEAAMRQSALDGLRGYSQDHYGTVKQHRATDYVPRSSAGGYQVLREPAWNKSTSFTPDERVSKNLTGLIPHVMESLETQCMRAMRMINSRGTNVDKYLYLSSIKATNTDLFYRLLIDNVAQLMPLVYTPTIGDVCLQYSTLYTHPEALYISIKQRKSIKTILQNWPYQEPSICVVTDGSRILGLGDLGVNGVGISIGKLALYTGAAGIHPEKTLPIVLDCGTANEDNLRDPLYLGLRMKRPSPKVALEFMDEFMTAVEEVYPNMLVQFEDFETEKAFHYLERYKHKKCFNDDIQGTGAVVLAGYMGAVNLSGVPMEDQRLVFMGAGSAGVGVAKQVMEFYTRRGLSEKEARDKFFLVDTRGLVTKDRGDNLAEHKKLFARTDNNGHQFRTLEEVIEYVKPTALIGLTATHGVFTESVVRALKVSVDAGGLGRRPILFPLSNPLTKAECTFEQAITWTEGTVIFASGSPFSPFTTKTGDMITTYYPNQGNNVYVFPGLGLGAILAKASRVTDGMVYTSAAALSGCLNREELQMGLIYPKIERVRDASVVVAREVMKSARREGVSLLPEETWIEWEEWGDVALTAWIKKQVMPLPIQRRLTKMYTDTKSSYDFVKEPVQSAEDPELKALHRKLRIQKDRLVSWGLEWSDPSQSPDIDESISKAGLSELVGSVMTTIKEILAEAEPLWQSSKRQPGEKGQVEITGDRKQNLISWDKSRFEDLVRDLTMSIDTLYDLSKTRQSARSATGIKSGSSRDTKKVPAFEERQFESTRMSTPQQIDPLSLIWPKDIRAISPSMLPPSTSSRQIVFMRRPTHPTGPFKTTFGQLPPVSPVLLEHAPYDPIYSITGINPSMTRFEKLFAGLAQAYISSDRLLSGLLRLIGYFEEPEHSRFCLLFALPNHFGPADIESPTLQMPAISNLSELLFNPQFEPTLEIKYRLACNISNAVFDLHSKGVVHGHLVSSSVLFFEPQPPKLVDLSTINIRHSYLASFDLFSDNATDNSDPSPDRSALLYRHPLDPRMTRYTRLTFESKSLDLYSLAMLLIEIGLWTGLPNIFPGDTPVAESTASVFKALAVKCGSLYVKAVQSCFHSPEDELSQKARPDVMHQKVFWRVSKALDACCIIDEVDDDAAESVDSPISPATSLKTSMSLTPLKRFRRDQKTPTSPAMGYSASPSGDPQIDWSEKPKRVQSTEIAHDWSIRSPSTPIPAIKPKPKLRTYPAVRISQEHLNFWHTGLMPHINYVLRGFYKKYPESVEISLESIGESSTKTKPTILVICTSVSKVRSILKKSLVYDKSTYGLKVCRGKVVRSRKNGVKRSMAKELEDMKPANPGHQERPANGASIGAYIGERHLPPVSFGGLIMVDDKPYGMTVHHMLDNPEAEEELDTQAPMRSSAHLVDMPDLTHSDSSVYSSGDEEFMYDLSDYESDASGMESEVEDGDISDYETDTEGEPGDIDGIPQGCGEEYIITQPAIDDVAEDFYPSEETRDEDHLDSCGLGEVYASSGIRRRTENGTVHEVDWALFEFNDWRRPLRNYIRDGQRYCQIKSPYPLTVAPVSELSDLAVHCMARTSGLQTGRILPGMVIIKVHGRQTPASSFQVAGKLGVPGDSGAWIIDNENGRACGHVLAWSSRKKVAYICPMDVLLRDIGETLNARRIALPGGEKIYPPPVVKEVRSSLQIQRGSRLDMSVGSIGKEESEEEKLGRILKEDLQLEGEFGSEYTDGSARDLVGSLDRMRLSAGLYS
ncbi:hypothetical protein B7494_g3797 [Chlorociboria aeruginascens]|nr:hypothetical protein B7494_g3797 [Chlorociboria aeruginascens]